MRKTLLWASLIAVVAITYTLTRPPRGPRPPMVMPIPNEALDPKTLKAVAASYDRDILPLFKRACMDCHSDQTVFPWYHHVPGVAQYLDGHIKDAREGLDLGGGVPFNTKTPLMRHLRRISGQVNRGSMPLWDYALMHPAARLSEAEKQVIVDWADGSQQSLSATAR